MSAGTGLPDGARIGCVPYLNARPMVHGIESRCLFAHPSVLAEKLFDGELEAALVPVAEWFGRPEFLSVGSYGICSDGPVYSVVLAGIDRVVHLEEVLLDDASRTSAALTRLLLAECPPARWTPVEPARIADITPAPGCASLLIGDQAIRFRNRHPGIPVLDLGQAWKERTGLPFVFALWICRPDYPQAEALGRALDASAAAGIAAATRLPKDTFDYYYLNHAIRYAVGERELAGLALFKESLQRLTD